MDATDQEGIDAKMIELDGTANKGNLGANAILGASLAVSKAGAGSKAVPLYQHYADLAGNSDVRLFRVCAPQTRLVFCALVEERGSELGYFTVVVRVVRW